MTVSNDYLSAFGKGYQPPGKEARLCFADINAPDTCLNKHILMIVRERKDSHTQFDMDDDTWFAASSYSSSNPLLPAP
ncbi:DUF943 family protein [Cronobacter muytjensii]|uniref:DUF943 family protein n=1 Tax=Cronobacter muytjensii TaxID=413501 RepID=UPI001F239085|nr:DUF943 family protein [Cronobacter muytjensii]